MQIEVHAERKEPYAQIKIRNFELENNPRSSDGIVIDSRVSEFPNGGASLTKTSIFNFIFSPENARTQGTCGGGNPR
jgi:hypothetical protein